MRIAMLSYRSKPHCGGQGIYLRHLSRELVALGHEVEVFSGQPYPELDEGVALTKVPSLDLYREPDPFRVPHPREFRDRIDVEEFATMCVAGFPEPKTFSSRVARLLRERAADFDIAHDNQVLGYGMLDIEQQMPLITTLHHPITFDRRIDISQTRNPWRKLTLSRWYGFLRMQGRVARAARHIMTPSETSKRDIAADFGDIGEDRNLGDHQPRHCARSHAHRGFACAAAPAPAIVAQPVFRIIGVIGMAGAVGVGDLGIILRPLVGVLDQQRDRRARGGAFEHA